MPSYVNAGTRANSSGATSLTPALPASRTTGNLLIAIVGSKNNFTHTSSSAGWTKYDQRNSGTGWTVSLWVYRRTQGGVDGSEAAPAIAVGSSSVACFAQIIQFAGPFDPTDMLGGAVNVNTGTTSTHTCNGIVTTADNSLVIYIDAAAANTALATPTGWTEELSNGSNTEATWNANGSKAIASRGTSSDNISVIGASAAWVMWQIELRSQVAWVTSKFETDASQSSYTFPSRTPDAQKAQLVLVFWFHAGATPNPTLSGCGLTWTKVAEAIETSTDQHAAALFKGTGTPVSGVVTVSFGTAPSRAAGVALEIDNVDKTDPIKQFATAVTSGDGSLTVTLPTAPTGTVVGAFNAKFMPQLGSGFAEVTALAVGSSWDQIRCRIETKSADRTIDATFDFSACVAIGFELKPPATGYTLAADAAAFTLTGLTASLRSARLLSSTIAEFALTGIAAGLRRSRILVADAAAYTLTGSATLLRAARSLSSATATFAMIGVDAALHRGVTISASAASFTFTGFDAGLNKGQHLLADAAAFTLIGPATSLHTARSLSSATAAFAMTGVDAALHRGATVSASAASFTFTGFDAGLNKGQRLAAETATYALSGPAASLRTARSLLSATAAFALTGVDAALRKGVAISANAASFTFTGFDAGLNKGQRLAAETATYALTGSATSLRAARSLSCADAMFTLAGVDILLHLGAGRIVHTGVRFFIPSTRTLVLRQSHFARVRQDARVSIERAGRYAAVRRNTTNVIF
jgi:hypothetical protein